ncbi:MAG: hypothetical protein LBN74_05850 [Prevotella sp.]|jgi:hypothetical protein|nr:hypothetical protein [Prevotella sp.]
MSVRINDIIISDSTETILKSWQESEDSVNPSLPCIYVNNLCNIQDFLCRLLDDLPTGVTSAEINTMLSSIIYIKDDLKMFIIQEGGRI